MKNYYNAITAQMNAGLWTDCLVMFDRAWTLDFYYRLYSLVQHYEPHRRYGYKQRILNNDTIIRQMGPSYNTIDENTIKKAIRIMEKDCKL